MSFGWSASDIVAGIKLLVKVGKALQDSGGAASEYQETVHFLTSLDKTLTGLTALLERHPDLKWEAELIEQGQNLRAAIETFGVKIAKYDLSLNAGSERKKARRIPREVQFALAGDVKDFKGKVEQAQMLLNNFILLQNLESVIDISKSSSMLLEQLASMADGLKDSLSSMAKVIEESERDFKDSMGQDLKQAQQQQVALLNNLSSSLSTQLDEFTSLQETSIENQALGNEEFRSWRLETKPLIQDIGNRLIITQAQHDSTLQELEELRETRDNVQSAGAVQAAFGVVQVFATGIASWIGASVAFSQQKQQQQQQQQQRDSCDQERHPQPEVAFLKPVERKEVSHPSPGKPNGKDPKYEPPLPLNPQSKSPSISFSTSPKPTNSQDVCESGRISHLEIAAKHESSTTKPKQTYIWWICCQEAICCPLRVKRDMGETTCRQCYHSHCSDCEVGESILPSKSTSWQPTSKKIISKKSGKSEKQKLSTWWICCQRGFCMRACQRERVKVLQFGWTCGECQHDTCEECELGG